MVANVVVPTPDHVRFATHYRFRPDYCEAVSPESKGMVENLLGYAKADFHLRTLRAGSVGRCSCPSPWFATAKTFKHRPQDPPGGRELSSRKAAAAPGPSDVQYWRRARRSPHGVDECSGRA